MIVVRFVRDGIQISDDDAKWKFKDTKDYKDNPSLTEGEYLKKRFSKG